MKKRIFSLVLALTLVMSVCSITVFAGAGDDIGSDIDWDANDISVTAAEYDGTTGAATITLSSTPDELIVDLEKIAITPAEGEAVPATDYEINGNKVIVYFDADEVPARFSLDIAKNAFSGTGLVLGEHDFEEVLVGNGADIHIPTPFTATEDDITVLSLALPDVEILKAEFKPDDMIVTFYLNQMTHISGSHLFFTSVPNPTGANDQNGVLSVNHVDAYTEGGVAYSDVIEVKFSAVNDETWTYHGDTDVPTTKLQSGVRFEEWNMGDNGNGYLAKSIIYGYTGAKLAANWNANLPTNWSAHDMYWIPTAGWADFIRANGKASDVAKYLGEGDAYLANYSVILEVSAIDIANIEITDANTVVITTDRDASTDEIFFLDPTCFFLSDGANEFYPTGVVAEEDGVTFTLTFAEDISKVHIIMAVPDLFYDDGGSLLSDKYYNDGEGYDFSDMLPEDENVLYGDADGNGVVEQFDITVIAQYLAGGYDVDTINEKVCDVDGNGVVEQFDITLIAQYLAGGYDVDVLGPVAD